MSRPFSLFYICRGVPLVARLVYFKFVGNAFMRSDTEWINPFPTVFANLDCLKSASLGDGGKEKR